MEQTNIVAQVEAIIFASGEPISAERLSQALDISKKDVKKAVEKLEKKYNSDDSGVTLLNLDNNYQLVSCKDFSDSVKKALEIKRNAPLSQAAMEVLAIIAYNQPVSKSFIEQVRGVDSSQTVNNLVEKGLVEEAGRLDVPGRPIIYKTALGFLKCFKLISLDELPPLPGDDAQMMIDDVINEANKKDIVIETESEQEIEFNKA